MGDLVQDLADALEKRGHSDACQRANVELWDALAELPADERRAGDDAYRCSCGMTELLARAKRGNGWRVTFCLHAAVGSDTRRRLADVLMGALRITDRNIAENTRTALLHNAAVRMRLPGDTFARFFVARRAAGDEAISKLRWEDAVEESDVDPRSPPT